MTTPGEAPVPKEMDEDVYERRWVFADLRFPAKRWEIVIHAQDYGVSTCELDRIWELSAAGVPSVGALIRWLRPLHAPRAQTSRPQDRQPDHPCGP